MRYLRHFIAFIVVVAIAFFVSLAYTVLGVVFGLPPFSIDLSSLRPWIVLVFVTLMIGIAIPIIFGYIPTVIVEGEE